MDGSSPAQGGDPSSQVGAHRPVSDVELFGYLALGVVLLFLNAVYMVRVAMRASDKKDPSQ